MELTYLDIINNFNDWAYTNEIDMKTQFVFLKILHLVNRRGWQEWTEISNKRLMEFSDICCENTFFRHRDRLVELGFIGYKKGKKGQPNKYKIIEKKFMELKKGFIASCTDKEFRKSMSENTCKYTPCNGGKNGGINGGKNGGKNRGKNGSHNKTKDIRQKTKDIKESISNEIPKKNEFSLSLRGGECENENFEAEQATPSEKAPRHSGITEKCQKMADLYCEICKDLPQAVKLSDKRKRQIIRLFELGYSEEDFKKVFENAQKSSFLCGKAGQYFRANLDWLVSENNFLKVLEGNYLDIVQKPTNPRKFIETSMNVEDWI